MSNKSALVIGASGGIGKAIVAQLIEDENYAVVHTVSRSKMTSSGKTHAHQVDSGQPDEVDSFCQSISDTAPLSLVVCCIGALHGEQNGVELQPEKRLEDIDQKMLLSYFQTNTVAPANWLKALPALLKGRD